MFILVAMSAVSLENSTAWLSVEFEIHKTPSYCSKKMVVDFNSVSEMKIIIMSATPKKMLAMCILVAFWVIVFKHFSAIFSIFAWFCIIFSAVYHLLIISFNFSAILISIRKLFKLTLMYFNRFIFHPCIVDVFHAIQVFFMYFMYVTLFFALLTKLIYQCTPHKLWHDMQWVHYALSSSLVVEVNLLWGSARIVPLTCKTMIMDPNGNWGGGGGVTWMVYTYFQRKMWLGMWKTSKIKIISCCRCILRGFSCFAVKVMAIIVFHGIVLCYMLRVHINRRKVRANISSSKSKNVGVIGCNKQKCRG